MVFEEKIGKKKAVKKKAVKKKAVKKKAVKKKVVKKVIKKSKALNELMCSIGTWDGVSTAQTFEIGSTLREVCESAGIVIPRGAYIRSFDGGRYDLGDLAESGKEYLIVGNFKNG